MGRETLGSHTFETMYTAERSSDDALGFPDLGLPSCGKGVAVGSIATTVATDPCAQHARYVVPPGYLFVLGDHRDGANDSHVWGAFPIEAAVGRVRSIWTSTGKHGRRWSRIGSVD
ncbi:MAG TPA: S26 family signal peptidase [Kofleriaceae bacterium]|nr:S26 family signal peptidase [Kofleriaceae bacterium]